MTPTLAIVATLAFVLLLSSPGAAAKRRRVGSGGGSYCVDDQNQRVLCGNTIAGIVGGAISGLCSLNHLCPDTAHVFVLTHHFFQFSLRPSTASLWLPGVATASDVGWRTGPRLLLPKITQRRAL